MAGWVGGKNQLGAVERAGGDWMLAPAVIVSLTLASLGTFLGFQLYPLIKQGMVFKISDFNS